MPRTPRKPKDLDAKAAAIAMSIQRNPTVEQENAQTIELYRLDERVTMADRALLLAAKDRPVDLDAVASSSTTYSLVWLLHYGLIFTWIDAHDRIWVRTSALGAMLIKDTERAQQQQQQGAMP